MWGAGCFAHQPPSSPPSYSSILPIPQGLYLSVAFIHNPRDLNLFPPHRPRLFFSLLLFKNFMLFFLLFSSLSCSSLFCLFLCYLFQSAQRFQHPYLQEIREEGEEGGVSIKWNEIWQNTEGKKIIKVASWQPQGRVKKDKESVNNVVRTAVFHCRYHANQFLRFCFFSFFFPGTDYERRQRCQDLASFTESLTVFWKCC